jgi:hypothetical protein
MIPVRTAASNFVYRGPTPDIGDAWVDRQPGHNVYLDWQPSDEEREAIAAGALIRLGIHGMEPIPPVSLYISPHAALSPAGEALRERAYQAIKAVSFGPTQIPGGYWTVSQDVWEALQTERALDPEDGGVPTLYTRPLMVVDAGEPGWLAYEKAPA